MKTFQQLREFLAPDGGGRGGGGGGGDDDHWNSFVKTLYAELKKIGFNGKPFGDETHIFVKKIPAPAGVSTWDNYDAIVVERDEMRAAMVNYFFGEMQHGAPKIDFQKDSHTAAINNVTPTVIASLAKTRFVGWPRSGPGKFGPTRRADYVPPVKPKRRK
jgi:hypothetical protein